MLTRDEVFQPWTIVGPREEEGSWVIHIEELPGFLVAGGSREEVLDDLLPALIAFLESFKASGEAVPVGRGQGGWSITLPPSAPTTAQGEGRPSQLRLQPEIDWTSVPA